MDYKVKIQYKNNDPLNAQNSLGNDEKTQKTLLTTTVVDAVTSFSLVKGYTDTTMKSPITIGVQK